MSCWGMLSVRLRNPDLLDCHLLFLNHLQQCFWFLCLLCFPLDVSVGANGELVSLFIYVFNEYGNCTIVEYSLLTNKEKTL